VTEAVDRLELVPDEEHLALPGAARQQVDQLALEPVRVLELVDHDRAEPQLLAQTNLVGVAEQVARPQLEILEVERRLAVLRVLVSGRECLQQLLQEVAVARRELVERSLLDGPSCFLVRRRALTAETKIAEVEQAVGSRVAGDNGRRTTRRLPLRVVEPAVVGEAGRRVAQLSKARREARPLAQLEHELASSRAQGLVDADQHAPQIDRSVDREQAQTVLLLVGREPLERRIERLRPQHAPLAVVEHAEPGVEPSGERVGPKQAMAEAVNGRDPGTVELARELGSTGVDEAGADPRPQLACGLLGVREDENRLGVHACVADGAREPLDEHHRLAGAGAGGDEHGPRRLDGRELLIVHARLTRHIGQYSHQVGQSPLFGSCLTSPSRIRPTSPLASSRDLSTCPQNDSSSR
jgi:hypothetical protein